MPIDTQEKQALSEKKEPRIKLQVAFLVVIFLCAATIGLGALQIRKNIRAPFLRPLAQSGDLSSEDQKKEALKKIDTDHDGLSDYDELYVYHTSPFIADSDSDGINDGDEVKDGEDPNCPRGKTCFVASVDATSTPQDNGLQTPGVAAPSVPAENILNLGANPAALRLELVGLGVPKAMLDRLNDTDLQKLYADTLKETVASSTRR